METRLITDPPLSGRVNMARDQALLEAGLPVLRFYQWSPPCVSVGYFQNIEQDIDRKYLEREGIELVRRPTGGRAVLHDHELTYCLVLPEKMLPHGVIPSYLKIAEIFLAALRKLGLDPELRGPDGRPGRGGVCFASSSAHEIAVGGRKLLGSAQVRRNGVVLQHGSLLLSVDYDRHARCMKGRHAPSAADLEKKMTGLFYERGPFDIREIIDCIVSAYKKTFDSKMVNSSKQELSDYAH